MVVELALMAIIQIAGQMNVMNVQQNANCVLLGMYALNVKIP